MQDDRNAPEQACERCRRTLVWESAEQEDAWDEAAMLVGYGTDDVVVCCPGCVTLTEWMAYAEELES